MRSLILNSSLRQQPQGSGAKVPDQFISRPAATVGRGARAVLPLAFALAFLAIGIVWSFSSPPGSTNDADYHFASIWCAWGEWDGCQFEAPVSAEAPSGQTASGNFWVPEYVRSVNCFQFASQSTACLEGKTNRLVDSNRRNTSYYPSAYYMAMRTVVLGNDETYLQVVRIANVLIAATLIGLAIFVSGPALRRAAILAWGLAAIPWVIMFAGSVHPSSWMVTGAGTFWIFLLALLTRDTPKRLRILSFAGLFASALIAIGSRFDGAAWLILGVGVSAIFATNHRLYRLNLTTVVAGGLSFAVLSLLVIRFNWNRLGLATLGVPEWNRATDQPLPILKLLLEFPWWIASFWGAQQPIWIPSDTEIQRSQAGYTPVGLSVNLGDFYFPSAVGYLIAGSVLALVVLAARYFTRRNWLALAFLIAALLIGVLGLRAAVFFGPQYLLSRYYFPWLILALGATFFIPYFRVPLVSKGQAIVLGVLLTVGGSIAWLAYAGRYAVNLSGTFTNFGQDPVWWWGWGPSRLVWFVLALIATSAWFALTLSAARSHLDLGYDSSTQLPSSGNQESSRNPNQ